MGEQFVHALGSQFLQGYQVVQNRTDGELELRGRWHGFPARLKLDMSFNGAEWELKGSNPTQMDLYLHWDPDAVPNVGQFSGDAADDWDDDDGEERVFFNKGYYLDVSDEADRLLAVYQSLPEPVRQALRTYMPGDRIARFYFYSGGSALLGYKDSVQDDVDPLNHLGRGLWLMGQMAWGLTQIDVAHLPQSQQPAPAGLLYKITCAYCGSMYLWSQSQFCPNCGAPPRG